MSNDASTEEFRYELRLSDPTLAQESEEWLLGHDVTKVSKREQIGVLPAIPFVIAATVLLPTLAALIMWIRNKTKCQLIIDARGEKVINEVDCRIRDGRVIVITSGDVKVQLTDVPELFDMGKVITAALSGGADVVRSVAKAAGAKIAD